MARKSAAQRQEQLDPSLPEVLIPPSQAKDNEREAYWLEILADPERLRAAVETTPFFDLLTQLPASLWGGRLSIYLYRLPDDDGLMVKTPGAGEEPGKFKFIKPVIRNPIDEEWIATKHGGGKYQAILKDYNDKENRNRYVQKYTFRIDGIPKVQAGQVVEVDGRPVSVGNPPAQPIESRSDIASVIQASADANKQNMEMLAEGSKAAIALVREQASAAAKPDSSSNIMDKLVTAMIERMMNPPAVADPIETFVKLQALTAKPNPEPVPEPKDPPLQQAMDLAEQITGKPFADIFRGAKAATPDPYAWVAPVASIAQQVIAQLPTIIRESRIARDQEFKRQVWLRTAKPGEAPPRELAAENSPAPPPPPQPSPVPQAQPAQISANDLAGSIVQMVCHGFDNNPYDGEQTAAAIIFSLDKQIVALGLDKLLTDDANVHRMVEGNPILKERSIHALWPQFEAEFMGYMLKNYGPTETEADNDDEEDPRRSPTPMPSVPRNELPTGA